MGVGHKEDSCDPDSSEAIWKQPSTRNTDLGDGFSMAMRGQACDPDDSAGMFDTLRQIIWSHYPDGSIKFFNQAWYRISGISSEDIRTNGGRERCHPDDRQAVVECWKESIKNERPFDVEFRARVADGSYRWHLSRGDPVRAKNGNITQWLGTSTDIHDLKTAEEKLKRVEHELRQERKLLSTIIDLLPVAVAVARAPSGELFIVNQTMNDLWKISGMYADSSEDYNQWKAFHPDGELYKTEDWPLTRALRHGITVVDQEMNCEACDGYKFTLSITATPIFDDDGNTIAAIASGEDLTERRKYESDRILLISREHAARESNTLKSAFLSTISHELRTPLNGIIGMTDLLTDTELSDDQKDMLNTIRQCGQLLMLLLNDLLDVSKIEAGKVELERSPFDVRAAIANVHTLMKPLADAKHVKLVAAVDPDVPAWVVGDCGRLKQIVFNLVGNGVKFTLEGLVTVHISIVSSSKPGSIRLLITCTDTGIGMTEQTQARLFTPFMQADSSTTRDFGGTGLGLSICKGLVDLMNGSISVESTFGVGTVFSVYIEVANVESHEAKASLNVSTIMQSPQCLASVRVLVVEDNPINQSIIKQVLRKFQVGAVTVCGNGQEAVDVYKSAPDAYDVCLMDCQMPGKDSF